MIRFNVLQNLPENPVRVAEAPSVKVSDYFACHVFNVEKQRKYLSNKAFAMLENVRKGKQNLDRTVADEVADGMRKWAQEKGVSSYTHWFHPLTDGTAEKHDAFLDFDAHGQSIEAFSGKMLVQQEPDASSFPRGGIRNTFEARGYSAWDVTSPAFIYNEILFIPSVFIAYTGEALDYKAPLLKAIDAVDKAAVKVCQLFDKKVKRVQSNLGIEQEYFLLDRKLYNARPDLVMCGRTLMGHESARNQQLEDHYQGAIPARVLEFMREVEIECYKLGIPAKTRHNEVAPNQFELAPIHEEMNLAIDHNLLMMAVMKRVAKKHHFKVLFHEKPFAGVNGSGKHNNWSLSTDTGVNVFSLGKEPSSRLQFFTFLVNTLMVVHQHNALLKASIASAGNVHRLGAAEAPPAIFSVFLGQHLSKMLDDIEQKVSKTSTSPKKGMNLDVQCLPEILVDTTDRNRTSPFAFVGNRFEFRSIGSSANSAAAMIALSAAMADQLQRFSEEVDRRLKDFKKPSEKQTQEAILKILKEYIVSCKPIVFDGNNYSKEWKVEAKKRGLDCETSIPKMFDAYERKSSVEMFSRTRIFSEKEIRARNEVKWEIFTKRVQIESRVLGDLAMNHIEPVAIRYQSVLLDNVTRLKLLFPEKEFLATAGNRIVLIKEISEHISEINTLVEAMIEARKIANNKSSEREKALSYDQKVFPYFAQIREHIDKLELIVDNEMWPLLKYRELLFNR